MRNMLIFWISSCIWIILQTHCFMCGLIFFTDQSQSFIIFPLQIWSYNERRLPFDWINHAQISLCFLCSAPAQCADSRLVVKLLDSCCNRAIKSCGCAVLLSNHKWTRTRIRWEDPTHSEWDSPLSRGHMAQIEPLRSEPTSSLVRIMLKWISQHHDSLCCVSLTTTESDSQVASTPSSHRDWGRS